MLGCLVLLKGLRMRAVPALAPLDPQHFADRHVYGLFPERIPRKDSGKDARKGPHYGGVRKGCQNEFPERVPRGASQNNEIPESPKRLLTKRKI